MTHTDPPPVADGCGLLPFVPRGSVASISVWRFIAGNDGQKVAAILPVNFDVDADEVALFEVAGGGVFRAQARDHHGRFVKGYPAREIYIEGPEREINITSERTNEPEAPHAPPPPEAPPALASQAVPVAEPLPGMPAAMLDVPGMDPHTRAWLARYDAGQAFVYNAIKAATDAQITAVQRAADAERAAAAAHTNVAVQFVEKVTSPQVLHQGEALRALGAQLEALRADLQTERAAHAQTRAQAENARVEAATYRALLQANGRYEAPSKGLAEIIVPEVGKHLGPTARVALASLLGIPPEVLAQLESGAQPPPNGTTHAG